MLLDCHRRLPLTLIHYIILDFFIKIDNIFVEDLETVLGEGVLSDETGAITNTFEFTDKKVKDILVPVANLITFDLSVTPRDLELAVAKHGFSRYVLLDAQGDIEGYLHLKDVIDADEEEADLPVQRKLLRTVKSIGGSVELEDALAQMQRDRQHLMASYDDSGALVGLLFLEDILEELVGEVQDATRRD